MKSSRGRESRRQFTLFALSSLCLTAFAPAARTAYQSDCMEFSPGFGKQTFSVKSLFTKGPQLAFAYEVGNFLAKVFVKGGEPLAVEYQLGAAHSATLGVTYKAEGGGEKTFTRRLEPTGGEAAEVKFQLPDDIGARPQLVELSVTAEDGAGGPPDFELLGLAMGRKAVGSIGIDGLDFRPDQVSITQRQKATYGYYSRFDFDRVRAEFRFAGRTPAGRPARGLVKSVEERGVRQGEPRGGNWDGKDFKGKVSRGRHQLVVCAWNGSRAGGDWACRWGRQRVFIQ